MEKLAYFINTHHILYTLIFALGPLISGLLIAVSCFSIGLNYTNYRWVGYCAPFLQFLLTIGGWGILGALGSWASDYQELI